MASITINFSEVDLHELWALEDGGEYEIGSYFFARRKKDIVEILHGNGDEWIADFFLTTLRPNVNYTLLQC